MWYVLLILGLVGAGIYTGSSGFYVAAGVVGAIAVLMTLVAAAIVGSVAKKFDKDFNSNRFDHFKRF